MPRRLVLLAVPLVLLAGCSGGKPASTAPLTSAAPSPTVSSVTPTETASPTPTTHLLGETVTLGGIASATAYAYQAPVAGSAPRPDQPGYTWGAADVKVCLIGGSAYVNNQPWSLVWDDSTRAEPSHIGYQQFPRPEYPFGDTVVQAGRCVRGWITFPVPAGRKPVMIEYQPQSDSPLAGTVVDWAVK